MHDSKIMKQQKERTGKMEERNYQISNKEKITGQKGPVFILKEPAACFTKSVKTDSLNHIVMNYQNIEDNIKILYRGEKEHAKELKLRMALDFSTTTLEVKTTKKCLQNSFEIYFPAENKILYTAGLSFKYDHMIQMFSNKQNVSVINLLFLSSKPLLLCPTLRQGSWSLKHFPFDMGTLSAGFVNKECWKDIKAIAKEKPSLLDSKVPHSMTGLRGAHRRPTGTHPSASFLSIPMDSILDTSYNPWHPVNFSATTATFPL